MSHRHRQPSLILLSIGLLALVHCRVWAVESGAKATSEKPRLLVMTDISNEPDDEESLVRLLVYCNEYELEGIVATTSVWLKDRVRPDLITRDIDAYGAVQPNLSLHATGFPAAATLRSLVKSSCPIFGMAGVGEDKDTEGSEWIIHSGDKPDPRPLWISIWGGANCLAQALWKIDHTRTASERDAFIAKLRVYAISDQDDAGQWIRKTFPGVCYIVSPSTVTAGEYYTATWTGLSGDRFYRNGPLEHFDLVDNPWLTQHIIENHGPLGTLYPKLAYVMEGDTPSFLDLIANGLAADESPDWGGWGGRYALQQSYGETRPIWTNSRDTVQLENGQSYTSCQATIWRWREAYQNDFAARMDWCVNARDRANHNPSVVVNGTPGKSPVRIAAKRGEIVRLSAAGSSDPDGDALSFRWFHYAEAGSPRGQPRQLALNTPGTSEASFQVPTDSPVETIHLILEVRDNGSPNLFSYRRILVAVGPR